jgi:hypothetical protein
MKKQTTRQLANFPLSWVMIASAVVGVIGVPALWLLEHKIAAIVLMLVVFVVIIQAACIDLPGSPYRALNKLWASKNHKSPKSDGN